MLLLRYMVMIYFIMKFLNKIIDNVTDISLLTSAFEYVSEGLSQILLLLIC